MILSHLKSRHLNSDLYPNLVVDKESNTATFPLFSYDYTDPGIIMHGYRAGDHYVTCEKCGKRKRI